MEQAAHSLEEFDQLATVFVQSLSKKTTGATLVTLSGELGAGKTAFTKAVAKALGVKDDITSPTFVLMKIYELPAPAAGAGFRRLIHIDAYRLENGAEFAPLRFDELTQEADNLIMLEWPEKVADVLPEADVRISIEALPDGSRKITHD